MEQILRSLASCLNLLLNETTQDVFKPSEISLTVYRMYDRIICPICRTVPSVFDVEGYPNHSQCSRDILYANIYILCVPSPLLCNAKQHLILMRCTKSNIKDKLRTNTIVTEAHK